MAQPENDRVTTDGASSSAPSCPNPWRFCVAPMLDWTDRHCRYFLRLISKRARLYTEMVTAPALLHGGASRLLEFDPAERPVALQLGGSDPAVLAHAARLGARFGYDEINLNCGCPSERVQTGSFGACLMAAPEQVAACLRAMRDAVDLPVTVKHRIGLDYSDDYGFVRDFVGIVADAGCEVFLVHARNAVLKGLSPKENREIPPLRHAVVHRLKLDFPALQFVTNGGLASWPQIDGELARVDGVMLGRAAYHDPFLLAAVDARVFGDTPSETRRADIIDALLPYVTAQHQAGTPVRAIARHVLGLYHGIPGARRYRRILSDAQRLTGAGPDVFIEARAAVEPEPTA
jgi:tRNA-dihydrouridine synthase A